MKIENWSLSGDVRIEGKEEGLQRFYIIDSKDNNDCSLFYLSFRKIMMEHERLSKIENIFVAENLWIHLLQWIPLLQTKLSQVELLFLTYITSRGRLSQQENSFIILKRKFLSIIKEFRNLFYNFHSLHFSQSNNVSKRFISVETEKTFRLCKVIYRLEKLTYYTFQLIESYGTVEEGMNEIIEDRELFLFLEELAKEQFVAIEYYRAYNLERFRLPGSNVERFQSLNCRKGYSDALYALAFECLKQGNERSDNKLMYLHYALNAFLDNKISGFFYLLLGKRRLSSSETVEVAKMARVTNELSCEVNDLNFVELIVYLPKNERLCDSMTWLKICYYKTCKIWDMAQKSYRKNSSFLVHCVNLLFASKTSSYQTNDGRLERQCLSHLLRVLLHQFSLIEDAKDDRRTRFWLVVSEKILEIYPAVLRGPTSSYRDYDENYSIPLLFSIPSDSLDDVASLPSSTFNWNLFRKKYSSYTSLITMLEMYYYEDLSSFILTQNSIDAFNDLRVSTAIPFLGYLLCSKMLLIISSWLYERFYSFQDSMSTDDQLEYNVMMLHFMDSIDQYMTLTLHSFQSRLLPDILCRKNLLIPRQLPPQQQPQSLTNDPYLLHFYQSFDSLSSFRVKEYRKYDDDNIHLILYSKIFPVIMLESYYQLYYYFNHYTKYNNITSSSSSFNDYLIILLQKNGKDKRIILQLLRKVSYEFLFLTSPQLLHLINPYGVSPSPSSSSSSSSLSQEESFTSLFQYFQSYHESMSRKRKIIDKMSIDEVDEEIKVLHTLLILLYYQMKEQLKDYLPIMNAMIEEMTEEGEKNHDRLSSKRLAMISDLNEFYSKSSNESSQNTSSHLWKRLDVLYSFWKNHSSNDFSVFHAFLRRSSYLLPPFLVQPRLDLLTLQQIPLTVEGCKILSQQYLLALMTVACNDEDRSYLYLTGLDLHRLSLSLVKDSASQIREDDRVRYLLQVAKEELMIYYHYHNNQRQFESLCRNYGRLVQCALNRVEIKETGTVLDMWLGRCLEALEKAIGLSLIDLFEFGPHRMIEYSTMSEAYSHLATYAYRAGWSLERKDDDHFTYQACWKNLQRLIIDVQKCEDDANEEGDLLKTETEECNKDIKMKKKKKKRKSYHRR